VSEQLPTPQQRAGLMQQSNQFMDDEIDLTEYFAALVEGKKLLAAIAVTITFVGLAYALVATPIYQADVLVQVEQKKSGGPLGELADMVSPETPVEAEIEILKSRSVLGEVVTRLGLDISAKPHYLPLIGRPLASLHEGSKPANPWLGASSFAWGGEVIRIASLSVPESAIDQPMVLVAGDAGTFELRDVEGEVLLKGKVGHPVVQGEYSIFVRVLTARAGTRFDVAKHSWSRQIGALQAALNVSEKGKKTGMLQMLYASADPAQAVLINNTIANVYLAHNVERKSEEAKQALGFIEEQLPAIRSEMSAAETMLNEYRSKQGSVDLNAEANAFVNKMVDIEKQKSEMDLQRLEMSRRYTENHPLMIALQAKAARINAEKAKWDAMLKGMPSTDQEILSLSRDAKVNQELYTFLLNKSQELKVAKAGTVGDVRIIDQAIMPESPIKPKRMMIVALSLVLGLFAGAAVVLIRKSLHKGIEDPDQIEQKLGLSIFASIPHSEMQPELHAKMRDKKATLPEYLLASASPNDMAVESLRSLRTNLHFGLLDARNNIVMVTGPAPGIGKSFVASNFSQVLTDTGQKVLLIDADMRKGHLHEYVAGQREPGLSNVLSGEVAYADVIQHREKGFDLLSSGSIPPNPAELLMHERFAELLKEVSGKYDLVLIDTPPVLAVTDAVLIGKHAATAFLLVKSGHHPMREIQQAVRHLDQGGVKVSGVIFNDISPRASYGGYRYGYRYGYHYQYNYKQEK
jgi:tyrosine-protein kinase Etk/Wzc